MKNSIHENDTPKKRPSDGFDGYVFVENSNNHYQLMKSGEILENEKSDKNNEIINEDLNLVFEKNRLEQENDNLLLQIKKIELETDIAKLKKSGTFSSPEKKENTSGILSQKIFSPTSETNAEKTIDYVINKIVIHIY